ncbi:MAG TPA: VCBS repeat-containing protein, partial [Planctomycetaceae bacterium]
MAGNIAEPGASPVKRRHPVERALVWTLIAVLFTLAVVETWSRYSYQRAYDFLGHALEVSDEHSPDALDAAGVRAFLGDRKPTRTENFTRDEKWMSNGAMHLEVYSWFTFNPIHKRNLFVYYGVSGSAEKVCPQVLAIQDFADEPMAMPSHSEQQNMSEIMTRAGLPQGLDASASANQSPGMSAGMPGRMPAETAMSGLPGMGPPGAPRINSADAGGIAPARKRDRSQESTSGAARSTSDPAQRDRDAGDRRHSVAGVTNVDFVDAARERGLKYIWPTQPRPLKIIDAFGCGCAAFDCDNDGWQDVLLVGDPHPSLFHNTGAGRFEDVTRTSGLAALSGDWTGCAIGDYDGDGLLDVLLTGYRRLALLRNLGGLRFEERTAAAGLDPSNNQNWASSAGFMDLDGDRRLDLVILNYVVFGPESPQYCEYAPRVISGCSPRTYRSEKGRIWRNTGNGGFELVPDAQGMNDTQGTALVLGFTDLDGDGRMDFYIGNDGLPADLLHNQGDMRFKNIAYEAGLALSEEGGALSAMTADWADYDRDGFLDLFVTNWQGSPFVVFRGLGQSLFEDNSSRTDLARSTRNRMGFGGKWADFQNDGWPDLFIVNGHVYDKVEEIQLDAQLRQPILLLSNDTRGKFVDLGGALRADVMRPMVGRGSATADFDNDGLVDLLAVDFEGPVMLLVN